jgi:hypothetical protein
MSRPRSRFMSDVLRRLPALRPPASRWLGPALLLLAGCADMPLTESGFLTGYDELRDAPERTVWGVPDAIRITGAGSLELSAFHDLYLEPVRFIPVGPRAEALSGEDRQELTASFEVALQESLSPDFRLVDASGPGVLTLRAAVTDAEPSTPWVNWVMLVLFVPTSYGGVSGEMELLDDSGRRLTAMTAAREGTAFLLLECFSRWGHARHSMEKWGAEWRQILRGG